MLVARDHFARAVGKRIGVAAELRTVATVGAAHGLGLAYVALPAITDAQRAVYEIFERDVGLATDGADLVEAQFAGKHYLPKTCRLEEADFLHRAVVGLRTCVYGYGRQGALQQTHVLDDDRIGTDLVQLPYQRGGFFDLVVVQNSVERDIHAGMEQVRALHQLADVVERIVRSRAGRKFGSADIYCIRAGIDSREAAFEIFGRCQ